MANISGRIVFDRDRSATITSGGFRNIKYSCCSTKHYNECKINCAY